MRWGGGQACSRGTSGSNWLAWDMLRKEGLQGVSGKEDGREAQEQYKLKQAGEVGHLRFLLLPTPLSRFLLVEGKCF